MTKRETPKKIHLATVELSTLRAVWGGGAVKRGDDTVKSTQKTNTSDSQTIVASS